MLRGETDHVASLCAIQVSGCARQPSKAACQPPKLGPTPALVPASYCNALVCGLHAPSADRRSKSKDVSELPFSAHLHVLPRPRSPSLLYPRIYREVAISEKQATDFLFSRGSDSSAAVSGGVEKGSPSPWRPARSELSAIRPGTRGAPGRCRSAIVISRGAREVRSQRRVAAA